MIQINQSPEPTAISAVSSVPPCGTVHIFGPACLNSGRSPSSMRERSEPKTDARKGLQYFSPGQARERAALGYSRNRIISFFPSDLAHVLRAKPEEKKEAGWVRLLSRPGASRLREATARQAAVLPWAGMWLPSAVALTRWVGCAS